MSLDQVANSYKQSENLYVKGIETPHGRVRLIFEQLEINLEKIIVKHPQTDFVAYGKVVQCFMILSDSLDFQKGESLAEQLNELYDYCVRTVKGYLTEKDVTKLEEVLSIVNQLSESWNSIEPK
ncbi:flagellar protein FliS [Paracoccaceae bacterium]|jgi:flagellar protein FliS|nr:flagellar protein FliS [Paracoccaceae bacterium]|tara:strand:- start:17 stop:388 length:372 start_codon:yes stop_codon:yes gene_type:complete